MLARSKKPLITITDEVAVDTIGAMVAVKGSGQDDVS